MALSTFTLLCNHHHHPSTELLSSCKTETPMSIKHQLLISPSPKSLETTIPLSVFINLTTLWTS